MGIEILVTSNFRWFFNDYILLYMIIYYNNDIGVSEAIIFIEFHSTYLIKLR